MIGNGIIIDWFIQLESLTKTILVIITIVVVEVVVETVYCSIDCSRRSRIVFRR